MALPPILGRLYFLGDRDYCATVNTFNNQLKIHIRKFFEPKAIPGEAPPLLPTKYGVALDIKEWKELMKIAPELNTAIEKYQARQEPSADNLEYTKKLKNKRVVNHKPYDRNLNE